LNFNGTRTQNHNGRRIEIQVRTRLQHSWATAVEAVGMFRGEHLKSHQGSDAWLRLFTLMSAEFALSEGCPVPPNVPDQATRILEIKALDKELTAIDTLENLSQAVRWTEEYVQPDDVVTKYYLIRYDNKTNVVKVEPYMDPSLAIKSYDKAEYEDNTRNSESENIVLVEVEKLEALKDGYPNYFGDVQPFKSNLKLIVSGKPGKEYTLLPQPDAPKKPREAPDLSWLRGRGRLRPFGR
jgi:hypothetical protein